jgi:hypothetical protein
VESPVGSLSTRFSRTQVDTNGALPRQSPNAPAHEPRERQPAGRSAGCKDIPDPVLVPRAEWPEHDIRVRTPVLSIVCSSRRNRTLIEILSDESQALLPCKCAVSIRISAGHSPRRECCWQMLSAFTVLYRCSARPRTNPAACSTVSFEVQL